MAVADRALREAEPLLAAGGGVSLLASGATDSLGASDSRDAFDGIRAEMLDEYRQRHDSPWVVGYSGGKDSTLVVHLVFEMLLQLPPSQRVRPVHVIANDTLVESPLVIQHVEESIGEMGSAARAFGLPVTTEITHPEAEQSFWVNLIGRGYPCPNQGFRWCTDRMKIQPTSRYIKKQVKDAGQVILLLGVRRHESSARSASVKRYDNGQRLNKHNDLAGCMVFRPIVELSTEEVWNFLELHEPPWGGSHLRLIGLYRDASGGECPVVTQKSDVPSCGTNSSRFGCWTCTVVQKDRSLEGFMESGFDEFGPLLNFRDWLVSIRNDKSRRQARRRDGRITMTDGGTLVPGPFMLETRNEILEKLRMVEKETGRRLISEREIDLIHSIWAQDLSAHANSQNMNIREIKKGK